MSLDFIVSNMSCEHCVARVKNAIKTLGFEATVNLQNGNVTVDNAVESDRNNIINAIEDLGFDVQK
ncbi:MAG: copper chaperone [Clostridiales bacterium]|nr:MAG: copper chaperone [Clostridiales bacterium]